MLQSDAQDQVRGPKGGGRSLERVINAPSLLDFFPCCQKTRAPDLKRFGAERDKSRAQFWT